jgi:hypothetical protein
MKEKDPVIAGVLNIIPGLGYLYGGARKRFGQLLLAGLVMFVIGQNGPTDTVVTNVYVEPELTIWDGFLIIGILVWMAAFIIDAYVETKLINEKQGKNKS